MNVWSSAQVRPYKAGYRRLKWHDAARDRPVWGDLWYPADAAGDEQSLPYGLGQGSVIPGSVLAAQGAPFPLLVLSHGASGSAPAYAWVAEYLARQGVFVLGVSHFGESFIYGPQSVDPSAVTRLWLRPRDCSFALTQLLAEPEFQSAIARDRIGALGHSSGGATVIALAGATFDPAALFAYCRSDAARGDRGCQYGGPLIAAPRTPAEATQSYHDPRIEAIVALDPAAGPGYSPAAGSSATIASMRGSW